MEGAFASFPPGQLDHLGGFLNHCTFWVLLCPRVGQRGLQGWCLISGLLLLQTPPRTSLSGDALGKEGPGLPLPGWALISAPFLETAKASVSFLWLDTQQGLQFLGRKRHTPSWPSGWLQVHSSCGLGPACWPPVQLGSSRRHMSHQQVLYLLYACVCEWVCVGEFC